MSTYALDLSITIDGLPSSILAVEQPLVRAVIISLFSWRRALESDSTDGQRWGWWGDGIEGVSGDRIGSRLWLLAREKLTTATIARAQEYALEALQWMLEDGVATKVTVTAERFGVNGLALQVTIERDSASRMELRFDNVWSLLNV